MLLAWPGSYRIPGSTRTQVSITTLRRYLKAYRSGGFDALRPVARADTAAPRAIPPDVLARAIALRIVIDVGDRFADRAFIQNGQPCQHQPHRTAIISAETARTVTKETGR